MCLNNNYGKQSFTKSTENYIKFNYKTFHEYLQYLRYAPTMGKVIVG